MRIIIAGPRAFTDTFAARRAAGEAFDAEVIAIREEWRSLDTWLANKDPTYQPRNPTVEGVISGGAKGVDSIAPAWAAANGYPFSLMRYGLGGEHCQWCLTPLVIELDRHDCPEGCRSPLAAPKLQGKVRNRLMAKRIGTGVPRTECVVMTIWDGMSGGTAHMIATGTRLGMVTRTIDVAMVMEAAKAAEEAR